MSFAVAIPEVSETASRALSMRELTTWNATRKALAISRQHPNAVVLGADTVVSFQGETIGKPADKADAFAILRRLSGREHQVCTAVYLCSAARSCWRSFCVISQVQFRALDDRQIRAYLAKIEPLDKAGAYAAQGHGSEIIRRIRGSYTNVVGLPMEETLAALAEFGIA